ncbi:MAG TPA: J domain-containing protein [Gaiellaceae bacterium]|nr:J domain-containing protein [Gaiellaceae bacterium]
MATTERDYYEILGLARTATDTEIKRSFRRLARELHPDVSAAPDAERRFREAVEAYEVLSDPDRRSTYDRFGHAGLRSGGFAPTDFGDLGDIFAAFFGDGLFGAAGRSSRPARGPDITAVVQISLAEAFSGTSARVPVRVAQTCDRCRGDGAEPGTSPEVCGVCGGAGHVQHVSQTVFGQFVRSATCGRCEGTGRIVESPCEACDGAGRILADRTVDVDVPRGIHDGQRIRLRGEGHAGPLGGAAGDVFVQVRVAEPDGLAREGDDLVVAVDVTMTEAALGTTVQVPAPDGDVELELPAGVQPGHVHVVRGGGMPSLHTGRRGDLRVHVGVRVPQRLTAEQRSQVLQLEEALGEDAYHGEDGFFRRLKSAFR